MKTMTHRARLLLLTGLTLGIRTVYASNPHLVRGPDASIPGGTDVSVSWKETGLGRSVLVH